jgi:hypothetical protein
MSDAPNGGFLNMEDFGREPLGTKIGFIGACGGTESGDGGHGMA